MNINGKDVLITGASGGIGQAIAREIAAKGGKVLLTARKKEVLESLAKELGGKAYSVDLDDMDAPENLFKEVGQIDILINNAGLPASAAFQEYNAEQIESIYRVNLLAPTQLSRLFLPSMVEKGEGHIVFISSLSGKAATPGSSLYSATKFGLRGLSFGMRSDLQDKNVGVSVVCPGFIRDAGMFAQAKVDLPKGVGTNTPRQVALGVVRAIEKNIAELDVAPVAMRVGTKVALVAPELARRVNKLVGADKMANDLYEGQKRAGLS